MAWTTFQRDNRYTARAGLEGPFHYPNGRVLYYDPREGEYWDPRTDFYVPAQEVADLKAQIFQHIAQ